MRRAGAALRRCGVMVALVLATAAVAGEGPAGAVEYRVTEVKRKLVRESEEGAERLAAGAELASGDLLRTGWFSRALIAAPARAATFRLSARTRVRLAHEVPGVLLEVERGRLRAVLDALVGGEETPRMVTTPSAVLAVRGTGYGVEVAGDGGTTVTVLEGVVEVTDRAGTSAPLEVRAGWAVRVAADGSTGRPFRHRLDPESWDRGGRPGRMAPGGGEGTRGPGGSEPQQPPSGGGRRGGGSGGHGG